jgi:hypothetical protein
MASNAGAAFARLINDIGTDISTLQGQIMATETPGSE